VGAAMVSNSLMDRMVPSPPGSRHIDSNDADHLPILRDFV
jgi:hypothetical protein